MPVVVVRVSLSVDPHSATRRVTRFKSASSLRFSQLHDAPRLGLSRVARVPAGSRRPSRSNYDPDAGTRRFGLSIHRDLAVEIERGEEDEKGGEVREKGFQEEGREARGKEERPHEERPLAEASAARGRRMTETPEAVRTAIWEAKLASRQHARYYTYLADRYQRWDRVGKLLVAVFSSSAFIGLFGLDASAAAGESAAVGRVETVLIRVFSFVTALLAIGTSIFLDPRLVQKTSEMANLWSERVAYWDTLWIRCESDETMSAKEVAKGLERDTDVSNQGRGVPFKRKLFDRCQREVVKSLGMTLAA